MYARDRAAELWERCDLRAPVDVRKLTRKLDLEVVTFPFRGRIKEAIIGRTIGVQPGLSRPWFRWYVAHAIGHHLMHVGTGFYLGVVAVGEPGEGGAAGRGVRGVAGGRSAGVGRSDGGAGYSAREGGVREGIGRVILEEDCRVVHRGVTKRR